MHIRALSTMVALIGLIGAGCDDGTQDQSPGEVLARDSVLASGLQRADTSSFGEDAEALTLAGAGARQPPVTTTRRSVGSRAPTREALRPVPAPVPPGPGSPPRLHPATERRPATGPTRSDAHARAVEILQSVPGASLPAPEVRRRGAGAP